MNAGEIYADMNDKIQAINDMVNTMKQLQADLIKSAIDLMFIQGEEEESK